MANLAINDPSIQADNGSKKRKNKRHKREKIQLVQAQDDGLLRDSAQEDLLIAGGIVAARKLTNGMVEARKAAHEKPEDKAKAEKEFATQEAIGAYLGMRTFRKGSLPHTAATAFFFDAAVRFGDSL